MTITSRSAIYLADLQYCHSGEYRGMAGLLSFGTVRQLWKGPQETLQLELLVCLHPSSWSLLVASSDFEVSTEFFLDSFAICYSEQGCNKCTAEEAVILHWNDYVTDCQYSEMATTN